MSTDHSQTEKLLGRSSKHARAIAVGQSAHRFKQRACHLLAQREWVVATERKSARADGINKKPQRRLIVDERVKVEAPHLLARALSTIDRTKIRPLAETMFDATDGEREAPSAVRETHLERREPGEHASKHERTCGAGSFSGHPHEPGEPVFRRDRLAHHVPWMDEDGSTPPRAVFEKGEEFGRVEVELGRMSVAHDGDIRADLDAAQAELVECAVEFAASEVGILKRDGCESSKTLWMCAHDLRNVVVQVSRQFKRRVRGLVVREHHRNRRKYLQRHAVRVALLDSHSRIPAVGVDVAEMAPVDRQPRTRAAGVSGRGKVLDREPPARSSLRGEVWPLWWKDVRVKVDCPHRVQGDYPLLHRHALVRRAPTQVHS